MFRTEQLSQIVRKAMGKAKVDRRVLRTRQGLHAALIALILEKRYDKITVQEIIDRANVGRSTFYAHFLDKDDLLISGFQRYDNEIAQKLESAGEDDAARHLFLHSLVFFRHAYDHHELYWAMLNGGGGDILMGTARRHMHITIQRHLDEVVAAGNAAMIPMPVVTAFLAGALLSVLTWWLDNGMSLSPEQINNMYQSMAKSGLRALIDAERAG
jgi:AcrR family transcriptional regulator